MIQFMSRTRATLILVGTGLLAAVLCSTAQEENEIVPARRAAPAATASPTSSEPAVRGPADGGIEVNADELEYDDDQRLMIGRGHVVVRRGADVLSADYMTFQRDTQDAHAKGHVVFEREGKVWRGEEMKYNFKTRVGNFGAFNAFVNPYFIHAKESQRTASGDFILKRARISPCEGEHPQFFIRAREARIQNETTLKARGVVFFLGAIPIFYVPAWTKHLAGDKTDIDFVPGYSSRMGGYLLTAYNYRLNPALSASTHLDYRSKRGLGVGQDFSWGDPRLPYRGQFKSYYTDDQEPMSGRTDDEKASLTNLVSSDRYRLRLSDVRSVSDRDSVYTELNYLSDPAIIEDFFDREFRHNAQPENRVTLAHRGDRFTAALELNRRLNDFYENVNRFPEARLSVPRLRLGDSPFYYESENSAAWLEKVFPEDSEKEKYDAFRIDSGHTVLYPTRHFGFLNVIPRAGYRGTYYSKTFEHSTVTNIVSDVDSNGVISVTNDVNEITEEKGAGFRNAVELGFETSFKAFKALHNQWIGRDDQGLRHIVEPYAYHTYVPEPNLLPEELPQFDDVDELNKRHDIRLGVRNKLQTKRRQRVHDLVDADVWSTYRIEKDKDEEDFSDIFYDVELRLADWWMVDIDGSYDQYEGNLSELNTQLAFILPDTSRIGLEYRYKRDGREQVSGELALFPTARWSFNAYGRYSIERSQLDEQAYFVQHKNDCIGWGLGYKQVDEDEQYWFQLWLVAFPSSSIDLGL